MRLLLALLLGVQALMLSGSSLLAGPSNPDWFARDWQTDDGLPDSIVYGVEQSSSGYLWVGTHSGLIRFDGERFTSWPLPIASAPWIRAMMLGRDETLWMVIESGEGFLLGVSKDATNLFRFPRYSVTGIAETPDGTVWVGHVEGHISSFRNGRTRQFGTSEGLTGSGGCRVVTDIEGRLWFTKGGMVGTIEEGKVRRRLPLSGETARIAPARGGGIWILNGSHLLKSSDGQSTDTLGEWPSTPAGVAPSVIYEDSAGGLWVGTSAGGLFFWDGNAFLSVRTSHNVINCIREDREGNLWVGTGGGGLNRLRKRAIAFQSPATGLPFESVRSLCEANSGDIWAVSQRGDVWRQMNQQWYPVPSPGAWSEGHATCVAADAHGAVWIGTDQGGLHRWQEGQVRSFGQRDGGVGGWVRSLLVARNGDVWIGLESSNCVSRLRQDQLAVFPLPPGSLSVRAMAEDGAGNIWMGTSAGKLYCSNDGGLSDETPRMTGPPSPVRCLRSTPDGSLWIGYAGAGVGWLHNGEFSRFGIEEGLPDNYICGIEQDDKGALWFSSRRGIFQVRQSDFVEAVGRPGAPLMAVMFGRNEGLVNVHGVFGAWPNTARGHDGRIWFATVSGVVVVSPLQTGTNRGPPAVMIARLLVDGHPQEIAAGGGIRVDPGHRKLAVECVALNLAAPETTLFRYRLHGLDDHWSEPTKYRDFTFPRLPAGGYEFEVTACNEARLWNPEGASLRFEVEPFLWQRWWFRFGVLGGLLGLVGAIVRYWSNRRLRRELKLLKQREELEKERTRIARDLHDDLGSSLAEISFLGWFSESAEVDPAELRIRFDNIVERTRRMTRSLDEIVWAVNPANDTLKATVNYLGSRAQEHLRAAQVRCRLDVQEELPNFVLPSQVRYNLLLAVTEAMTNVMKHAVASEVWLRIAVKGENLIIRVEDDGKGLAPDELREGRNGLLNMQRRCQELGGEFLIESVKGGGTMVKFTLSLTQLRIGRVSH